MINKSKNKKTNGFTLAEVLVTLLVIGVVAALTIPQLISSTNDQQLRVKYKKAFSDIQQATNLLAAKQSGCIDFSGDVVMRNQYETVLAFIKKGTFSDIFNPGFRNYYKNATAGWNWGDTYPYQSATLSDGAAVTFFTFGGASCTSQCGTIIGSLSNLCGYFLVDINGNAAPNMVGKDFMELWLTKNSNGGYDLIPSGYQNGLDGYTCVAGSSDYSTSLGCAYNALVDGPMP